MPSLKEMAKFERSQDVQHRKSCISTEANLKRANAHIPAYVCIVVASKSIRVIVL